MGEFTNHDFRKNKERSPTKLLFGVTSGGVAQIYNI